MNSENPYLRLRSYTETDAQYFKGRETESGEIFDLLQRNDVVVLYSESAEGKSSILAAGLYPRLRRHNFLPVSIVFTEDEFAAKSPDFDAIVLGRIRQAMAEANPGAREPLAPDFARKVNESECFEWVSTSEVEIPQGSESAAALTGSAWWMLRDFAIERYGVRVCPVLVFDQFEEVFTRASSAWTDAFFGWLERLFSDNVPEAVDKALDSFPEGDEPEFSTRKNFRTIVSMRNEYMGELDYWGVQRHFLPEFKNSRYCLRALTLGEAEEVLNLRFADRPELKKSVLAALSGVPASKLAEAQRDLPMVPAMLLSVVCGVLCEEKPAQKYLDNLKDGNSTAVDNILWDFYRTSMRMRECRIGPTTREYIENVLVDKGGKRVRTKVDSKALRRIGFRDKILPQLKKKGLVKTSRINGEDYVELVHDRLAAIIEKSRTRRSNSNQRVATMFIVILACLIMLFLGTRRQLYSDTLEGHPFAQLNNSGEREIVVDNFFNNLEQDANVRSAKIIIKDWNFSTIKNCLNLKTINIVNPENFEFVSIRVYGCPNLQSVNLEGDSLFSIIIDTDESFTLKLNPQLRHLKINENNNFGLHKLNVIPSTQLSESGIVNFESLNNIVFNNYEKSICYINSSNINNTVSNPSYSYYPFPESLKHYSYLRYNDQYIFQASFEGKEDSLKLKFSYGNERLLCNLTPFYSGHADLSTFNSLEKISSFENCSLSSITFPKHLRIIDVGAFDNCTNLQTLEFPDSLETIEPMAFANCNKLKYLKINSHTTIYGSSFPNLQISNIEITETPGGGGDSLHLCEGAILNIKEEPVLLTNSFKPGIEFAEKTGWIYNNGELYGTTPSDSGQYYNIAVLNDLSDDYLIAFNNLFFTPILDSGEVCVYDLSGKQKGRQPYFTRYSHDGFYFNNYYNRDSIIYISPNLFQGSLYFTTKPDSIREIHLPFGEPYYISNSAEKTPRRIILTRDQMMNTILYVPYGCADNYNIPEYKWFKEIREDSCFERYFAPFKYLIKENFGLFIIDAIILLAFILYGCIRNWKGKNHLRIKDVTRDCIIILILCISIMIPFVISFNFAISHGYSTKFSNIVGIIFVILICRFIEYNSHIIRFVSRIFNRYVIDPLALLFH